MSWILSQWCRFICLFDGTPQTTTKFDKKFRPFDTQIHAEQNHKHKHSYTKDDKCSYFSSRKLAIRIAAGLFNIIWIGYTGGK